MKNVLFEQKMITSRNGCHLVENISNIMQYIFKNYEISVLPLIQNVFLRVFSYVF